MAGLELAKDANAVGCSAILRLTTAPAAYMAQSDRQIYSHKTKQKRRVRKQVMVIYRQQYTCQIIVITVNLLKVLAGSRG
jgi:hypothetical protein